MTNKGITIQSLLPKTANPFLAHAAPAPGFSFGTTDINLWTFTSELVPVNSEGSGKRIRSVWGHPLTGLEFDLTYHIYPETGALEYSGTITNKGRTDIGGVKGPFSFVWKVDAARIGIPRLMMLSGGGPTDSAYPAPAFAPGYYDISGSLTLRAGDKGVSTQQNMPYVMVVNPEETHGFAAALEWPCSWMIYCSRGKYGASGQSFVNILMHTDKTGFVLTRGESIPLPKVTLVFFEGGIPAGINRFRRHVAQHVTPRLNGAPVVPPVFYNQFFGCADQFTTTQLKPIVDIAADMGVEYFVIDAGWFEGGYPGGRGNWEKPDRKKIPEGMDCFARYVRSKGMKFGAWLEIEYAVPETDWAIRHPDWYRSSRATSDLLLKLEDPNVRAHVMEFLEQFVKKNRIEWLRWDCNNAPVPFWAMAEDAAQTGKLQLGYGVGLYEILDIVLRQFPGLHIETSAGGGHRMDLGMLRRAHSCWMNDESSNIPAIRSRLRGLNAYVPGNYGNTCLCHMQWSQDSADVNKHPPAFFNHGYPSDWLRARMAGGLGFSENFTQWSNTVKTQIREEILRYKTVREYLTKDYYRLFSSNRLRDWDGWQFHDPETGKGFLMAFRSESPQSNATTVPGGFEQDVRYILENVDTGKKETVRGGHELPFKIEAPNNNVWLRYGPA